MKNVALFVMFSCAGFATSYGQGIGSFDAGSEYLCDSRLLRSAWAARIPEYLVQRSEGYEASFTFLRFVSRDNGEPRKGLVEYEFVLLARHLADGGPPNRISESQISGSFVYDFDSPNNNSESRIRFQLVDEKRATEVSPKLWSAIGFEGGRLDAQLRDVDPFLAYDPDQSAHVSVDFVTLPDGATIWVWRHGSDGSLGKPLKSTTPLYGVNGLKGTFRIRVEMESYEQLEEDVSCEKDDYYKIERVLKKAR